MAELLEFSELKGWAADNHRAALCAFLDSCSALTDADWRAVCRLAPQAMASDDTARNFFEEQFRPVLFGTPPAFFTGYYEPELSGSLVQTPRFTHPLYARPPALKDDEAWLDRATIEETGALRGLELLWLDDPVEVFFLQVQGSGRVRLEGGRVLRVGYAGRNGHPYRSLGQELIRQGIMNAQEISAGAVKAWLRDNPAPAAALMRHNPSFVFFRHLPDLPVEKGPIGTMGTPVTTLRSLAVDPAHTPLGAPVWIEKEGPCPMCRLMVAQDTGSAIKGAQRADIFFGTGTQAGEAAGKVTDSGRMVVLLPKALAFAEAG